LEKNVTHLASYGVVVSGKGGAGDKIERVRLEEEEKSDHASFLSQCPKEFIEESSGTS
jgi:hypothetical protein